MLSSTRSLLEHPAVKDCQVSMNSGISDGMELALFRAREALLAGWELTPEEALKLVGPNAWKEQPASSPAAGLQQEEDEVEDLALYFSDP